MNKNKHNKAFTLVELIVVITILAVLATVAFISFQGYAQSSRDSVRLADIKNIEKVINFYKLTNSKYPLPNDSTAITYSGSTAWSQGTFGKIAYTSRTSLSNVPKDPLTDLPYAYSVTNTQQEYQIAAVLEGEISHFQTQTYAGDQLASVYVRGDYNGQFIRVSANATNYLLGVPSIIVSDITSIDLIDILNNQRLVYKGYNNLPASFSGSQYNVNGGFNFTPNQVILFEGDIDQLESDQAQRIIFLDNLQTNYTGSTISGDAEISKLLAINSGSASDASNYTATLLNNTLKTKIKLTEQPSEVHDNIELTGNTDFDNFDGMLITIHPNISDLNFDYDDLSTYIYTLILEDGEQLGLNYDGEYLDFNAYGGYNDYVDAEDFLNGNTILPINLYDGKITIYAIDLDQQDIKIKVKYNYIIINGVCSSENGKNLYNTPTNLCLTGQSTNVIDNGIGNTYTWSCEGENGGTIENCSANHALTCSLGDEEFTLSNGQVWKCKNVGATTVWDGIETLANCSGDTSDCNTDISWKGDYYQWSRNDTGWDSSWPGYNSHNAAGWGGYGTTTSSGTWSTQPVEQQAFMQGPCEDGWHVPTSVEWQNACIAISGEGNCDRWDSAYDITNVLRLPKTGFHHQGGTFNYYNYGFYWSSTPGASYTSHLTFSSGLFPVYNYAARSGIVVRCLKN